MEEPILTLPPEDLVWSDEKHLDLGRSDEVKTLDKDLDDDPCMVQHFATNFGYCTPFRVLSEEGLRVVDHVVKELDKHSRSCPRIPKLVRGATFRNQFLNSMAHSEKVLKFVSRLAGCEMIYHPMKIHQLHINMKEADGVIVPSKSIDRWHCDSTPFSLVIFLTDPDEYTGGEVQYFDGPREEGMRLLSSGSCLPPERVKSFGRQERGYGMLMQGWRIFHQVSPVTSGRERTTMVYSFYPRNVLAMEACRHLSQTYTPVDPLHVILPDWVRFRAWKVMRRMEILQENLFPDRALACYSPVRSEQELFEVLNTCYFKVSEIVRTLPYTTNREQCAELLQDSIADLRTYLSLTYPDLMVTEKYGIERKRSGSSDAPPKPSFGCVADMNSFSDEDCDHTSPPHTFDFLASPYGLPNLLAAVEDIELGVQDVRTLPELESKIEAL